MKFTVSRAEVRQELDFLTDKLSTQMRTTALGALVFAWGLLVGDSAVARSMPRHLKWHLMLISGTAILTMLFDFAQYSVGFVNVYQLYLKMKKTKQDKGEYDEDSITYKSRFYLFMLKMCSLLLTVLWLLFVIGSWLAASYNASYSV